MSSNDSDEDVEFFFIIPENMTVSTCHIHLQEAFEASKSIGLKPVWKPEKECLEMSPSKQTVFVFQQFEGSAFSHLRNFPCALVGPRCVLSSLELGKPIPFVQPPAFTSAMRDMIIAATGFSPDEKAELKRKIEFMAGTYTSRLLETSTHLVVASACSHKYEKACEMGVKLYTSEWVDEVWRRSLNENILATDADFDKHKCPPFLGVAVCTSNLKPYQTSMVKNKVLENGGSFSTTFDVNTKILVVRRCTSEKFKAAKSRKIPCVSVDWILRSVEEGYALPTKNFEICGTMASSPNKGSGISVEFASEGDVSVIPFGNQTHINETVMDSTSMSSLASYCSVPAKAQVRTPIKTTQTALVKTPVKSAALCNPSEFKYLLGTLELPEVKAAGSFLDGCRVYLSGWNAAEEEKLKRIIKISGAVWFDELSDRTSHVLVGQLDKSLTRLLKSLTTRPHVVSIKWLIESVTLKQPAAEDLYNCFSEEPPEAPSPLSKKGMAILQQGVPSSDCSISHTSAVKAAERVDKDRSNVLLEKYQGAESSFDSDLSTINLKPVGAKSDSVYAMPPPPAPGPSTLAKSSVNVSVITSASDTINSESELEEIMVFKGLKFIVCGLVEESRVHVEKNLISTHGGEVVNESFKGVPDFAIVPLTGAPVGRTISEIVTILWLEDCIASQSLCPIEFFHKPVAVNIKARPLKNCVLGVSGYTHKARQFVLELSQILGAVIQEVFARLDKPTVKASTHLICKSTERGQKFNAAVKWRLPAVTHEWLLACASSGEHVSEKEFLLNPDENLSFVSKSDCTSHLSPKMPVNQSKASDGLQLHHDPERIKRLLEKPIPENPFEVRTPDTPVGISNPKPREERKKIAKWINLLPDPIPLQPSPPSDSPSLDELRIRRIREDKAKLFGLGANSKIESPISSKSSNPQRCSISENVSEPKSPTDGTLEKLKKLIETPNTQEDKGPVPAKRTLMQHIPKIFDLVSHKSDPLKGASQTYDVLWEDPVNLPETASNKKRKSSESCEEEPLQKKPPKEKVFLMSHVEQEKNSCVKIINLLNGTLIDTSTFDARATHLVIERPARSEKLLSAIASGTWILHVSYLTDSYKSRKFLEEELYEWGNPQASKLETLLMSPLEISLSQAAYRWRSSLAKSGKKGAFSGMRFVIKATESKTSAFSRLITYGGGSVVMEEDATKGDVCIVEHAKVAINFFHFAKKEVVCVPVMYINELLILDPPPTPQSKALPAYLDCLKQVKNK